MSKDEKAYITFASQMGDQNAANIVQPHLIELRKLLKKYCNEPYSPDIQEFAPIAIIDGDIWYWNFEGCQKLRFNKKERYLTLDIGMPKNRWDGVEEASIRRYLLDNLKEGLNQIVKRLKKDKIQVDDKKLFSDFEKGEKEYMDFI